MDDGNGVFRSRSVIRDSQCPFRLGLKFMFKQAVQVTISSQSKCEAFAGIQKPAKPECNEYIHFVLLNEMWNMERGKT